MRSDVVKKGPSRAPHRSLLKATGLTDEEIDQFKARLKAFGIKEESIDGKED